MFKPRRYSELIQIPTFVERLEYLMLDDGHRFEQTFGQARYLNQELYKSPRWHRVRRDVIVRDNGCDLGVDGLSIDKGILVHHIIPITIADVLEENPRVYDPDNLICCTQQTHHAIHYGHDVHRPKAVLERQPFDTCPWR